MSQTKLLPCPFCGAGETQIQPQNMWTGMRNQILSVQVRHWCERKEGDVQSHINLRRKTEAEAIAAWNRRAAEPVEGTAAQQSAGSDASIAPERESSRMDSPDSVDAATPSAGELVKVPCCGYQARRDDYPVRYNDGNGVVQCHNCGHVWEPQDKPAWAAYTQGVSDGISGNIAATHIEQSRPAELSDAEIDALLIAGNTWDSAAFKKLCAQAKATLFTLDIDKAISDLCENGNFFDAVEFKRMPTFVKNRIVNLWAVYTKITKGKQ